GGEDQDHGPRRQDLNRNRNERGGGGNTPLQHSSQSSRVSRDAHRREAAARFSKDIDSERLPKSNRMGQPAKKPLDPEGTRYQIGRDAAETKQVSSESGQGSRD